MYKQAQLSQSNLESNVRYVATTLKAQSIKLTRLLLTFLF